MPVNEASTSVLAKVVDFGSQQASRSERSIRSPEHKANPWSYLIPTSQRDKINFIHVAYTPSRPTKKTTK